MEKDKYIIPHYPFYNEPKLVAESQKFVQDVRDLLEKIDAEYAIPDELKALEDSLESLNKVSMYVASKQYGAPIPHDLILNEQELKAADYYLKAGDKGKRIALICNELFSKMVGFTLSLDSYAKSYKTDQVVNDYIEDAMDKVNGKYGNENELCLFCHSKETNGNVIIHESNCPISFFRDIKG